ncbi:hypothetical protein [Endothiovibrio diazotrophicus]
MKRILWGIAAVAAALALFEIVRYTLMALVLLAGVAVIWLVIKLELFGDHGRTTPQQPAPGPRPECAPPRPSAGNAPSTLPDRL